MKKCPCCKETKTDAEFYPNSTGSGGLSPACRKCTVYAYYTINGRPEDASNFGEAVLRGRMAARLSRQELASKAGCGIGTIEDIEHRRRDTRRGIAVAICQALSLPAEVMLLP